MAKIDEKKIISHLKEKWEARLCPMCGKGPWNVQDSTYQLMEFNEGAFVVGGPVIPVIPITCGNCGNTVLVNAILSGIMQSSAPPYKEETK